MKLSADDAVIPAEKLRDYILDRMHPDGRAKAEYLGRVGYSAAKWRRLEGDLRDLLRTSEARPGRVSPYGEKYEILGSLTGPNGGTAWVRSIWIMRTGETAPRLVTLIPEARP